MGDSGPCKREDEKGHGGGNQAREIQIPHGFKKEKDQKNRQAELELGERSGKIKTKAKESSSKPPEKDAADEDDLLTGNVRHLMDAGH